MRRMLEFLLVLCVLWLAQVPAAFASDDVRTWGRNDLGQLGDGTTINRNTPVPVTGLPGVVAIVASLSGGSVAGTTFAIRTDRTVKAWGANPNGQLGIGISSTAPHNDPGRCHQSLRRRASHWHPFSCARGPHQWKCMGLG